MPSKSTRQQRAMGMALAEKRGQRTGSRMAERLARSMSERQLKDFASRKDGKRSNRRSTRK